MMLYEEAVTDRDDMRRREQDRRRVEEMPCLLRQPIISVEGNWSCVKEREHSNTERENIRLCL